MPIRHDLQSSKVSEKSPFIRRQETLSTTKKTRARVWSIKHSAAGKQAGFQDLVQFIGRQRSRFKCAD